ncbi:MAG TPA: chemotaxis protein CheB [Candidatus Eisenbacteria bacterium]|nr:chemotaxis protein CheB [Candidatus Eisenbacteria bacterium]
MVVGIGASAGGLDPLTEVLRSLPARTGMAFVVIQHLDPTHPSMLTEILGRATRMPVVEARDGMKLEADRVFVIPPNADMVVSGEGLAISPRTETRGQHRPIDRFLLSLAQDYGSRAVGVILSGTASDGTQGMAAINAEGGITFAQDASATHDSMPRSAIAAGIVDHVLPPAGIAQELVRIARHAHPGAAAWQEPEEPKRKASLDRILRVLQSVTNVDFTHYRGTTLYRRIARRMALHHLEQLSDYARFLQENPAEASVLHSDILISVTSFFRDPDTFEYVQREVIPRLARKRSHQAPIRIWVLGCSTGEEAYSIAILLTEYMDSRGASMPVQIYATDLNNQGIEKARAGLYPREIAQDVSPDRLRRFFVETEGGYRIIKPIRDMCVFASQNVLTDPPFSRMDLVSCRNLLIYLEPVIQKRIVPALHYSLKPDGILWLGGSESIGGFSDLFEAMDPGRKVYVRKPGPSRLHPASGTDWRAPDAFETTGLPKRVAATGDDLQKEADRAVIARYVPVGVLVDSEMEILQFRGDTSPYLAPPSGRANLNLLKMTREGLLISLRAALHRANKENRPVREVGVTVKTPTGIQATTLEVIPLKSGSSKGGGPMWSFSSPTAPRWQCPQKPSAISSRSGSLRKPSGRSPASARS